MQQIIKEQDYLEASIEREIDNLEFEIAQLKNKHANERY